MAELPGRGRRRMEEGSTWMERHSDVIGKRRITEVSLPGSHDSATCAIRDQVANDEGGREILAVRGTFGKHLSDPIVRRWCKTQPLSIREQLRAGVRYLDLRVGRDASQDTPGLALRTCHGFFSTPAQEVLRDVAAFVKENQAEIVLLDFNHLYGLDEANHAFLLDAIEGILSDLLVPRQAWHSPIADLAAAGKRIFVFYHWGGTGASERPWALPGSWCRSPWPNESRWEGLAGKLDRMLDEMQGRGKGDGEERVHVLQGIITGGRDEVVSGVVSMLASACCACFPCLERHWPWYSPSSVMQVARDVNPRVIELIQRRCTAGLGVNVVLVDWIRGWSDVSWIVELNLDSGCAREL